MAEYIITDGMRFIYKSSNGKYVPTPSEAMADKFSKIEAETVLGQKLAKPLRNIFYLQKYDIPANGIKQITREDLSETASKVKNDDNIQRWMNRLAGLNGLDKDILARKNELKDALIDMEKQIQDCLHYIEFSNLNATQGYKIYKILKEKRVQRRKIKNEIAVLDIILEKNIQGSILGEIQREVDALDNRVYTPRVLSELFDL